MIIIQVHVHVKPDKIEAFRLACIENARQSIKEKGIVRFDVIQQKDSPDRFILIEAYRNQEGITNHKETLHYRKWRDQVADMMAEPRYGIAYTNVFPDDHEW